jgi:hypothetical protein
VLYIVMVPGIEVLLLVGWKTVIGNVRGGANIPRRPGAGANRAYEPTGPVDNAGPVRPGA